MVEQNRDVIISFAEGGTAYVGNEYRIKGQHEVSIEAVNKEIK